MQDYFIFYFWVCHIFSWIQNWDIWWYQLTLQNQTTTHIVCILRIPHAWLETNLYPVRVNNIYSDYIMGHIQFLSDNFLELFYPLPHMWHFTFLNNCFQRLLGTEVWNELKMKRLLKPNLALLKMTFYFWKPINQSSKSKSSCDTLLTPSPQSVFVIINM